MREKARFQEYIKQVLELGVLKQVFPPRTSRFHEFYLGEKENGEKVFIKVDKLNCGSVKREGEILLLPPLTERIYFPPVIYQGQWEGKSFIVFEFIEGTLLRNILSKKQILRRLPKEKVLQQLVEIGLILNREKIIHRDIRPGNIYVQWKKDGGFSHLALIDFAFSVGVERFPELPLLVKRNMLPALGTGFYKPSPFEWDNFFAIEKVARKLDRNYARSYPELAKQIKENKGQVIYTYEQQ